MCVCVFVCVCVCACVSWGTPGVAGWGSGDDYDRKVLEKKLNTTAYLNAASSWAEQRIYNALALAALEVAGHPLATAARAA